MKLRFRHQQFQADAAKAVCDVFAGQSFSSQSYVVDSGLRDDNHAKQGSVGLVALFIAYCGPFWLFMRMFRATPDPALRAVSAAGMLVPLAYFGFGLTESFLPHVSVITVYVYFLSLLWGAAWGLQSTRNSSDGVSVARSF